MLMEEAKHDARKDARIRKLENDLVASQQQAIENNNAATILHGFINTGQARMAADGTVELLNQQAMEAFEKIETKRKTPQKSQ